MPSFKVEIADALDYITNPVITKVMRDIAELTSVDGFSLEEVGELAARLNTGSALTEDPDREVSFGQSNKIKVSFVENDIESSYLTMGRNTQSPVPFFQDMDTKTIIRPQYTRKEIRLNFTVRFQHRNDAESWRKRFREMFEMYFSTKEHFVEYMYPIPATVLNLINDVHVLRESNLPYGQTLVEYMQEKVTSKFSTASMLNGKKNVFVIRESQSNIAGVFENYESPEANQKEETGAHEIEFSYKIEYHKPTHVLATYPLVVNNSIIDSKYIPRVNVNENLKRDDSLIGHVMQVMGTKDLPVGNAIGGFNIPDWDPWRPTNRLRDTSDVFRLLTTVDPDDTTLLIDFGNLGDYTLHPEVLKFINDAGNMAFSYGHSAFNISLYENENRLSGKTLSLTDNILRTSRPLDPRKVYHVTLTLLHDLSCLSENGTRTLVSAGNVARMLLEALEPKLHSLGLLPDLQGTGINGNQYREAVDFIKTTNPNYSAHGEVDRIRIGSFTVVSRRS